MLPGRIATGPASVIPFRAAGSWIFSPYAWPKCRSYGVAARGADTDVLTLARSDVMRWFVGCVLTGGWLAYWFLVGGVEPAAVAEMSSAQLQRLGFQVGLPLVLLWLVLGHFGLSARIRRLNESIRALQRAAGDDEAAIASRRKRSRPATADAEPESAETRAVPRHARPRREPVMSAVELQAEGDVANAPVSVAEALRPTVTGSRMLGADLLIDIRNDGNGARELMVSADRGIQAGIEPRDRLGAGDSAQLVFRTLGGDFPGRIGFDVSFRDPEGEVRTEELVFVVAEGRIRRREIAPSLTVEARARR